MNAVFFANPAGLWALAAVPAVAVLYLFYRRFRPRPVTGLFLWGIPRREGRGGRKVERPLWNRSFLFDLLAAACFGLALAGPALMTAGGVPLAIILDDSFSMRARDGRRRAIELAVDLARAANASGRATPVILAGVRPRLLTAMDASAAEVADVLAREYAPSAPTAALPEAVSFARDLLGTAIEAAVVTNRPEVPGGGSDMALTAHILDGRGDNLGFDSIWRLEQGEGERLFLTVRNHGDGAAAFRLTVARLTDGEEGVPLYDGPERIGPRERVAVDLTLEDAAADTLVLRLVAKGEDVIADDSVAYAPPSPARTPSFSVSGLSGEGRRFFVLALEAAGCREAEEGETADLLVTSRPDATGRCLTLEVAPIGEPGVFSPPYVVDFDNDLCRDVNLAGVPWTIATRESPAAVGEALIAAGRFPLYWRSSANRLHLNLLPELGMVVLTPAWPTLLSNLADETRRLIPGLARTAYRPGEILRYRPAPEMAEKGLSLRSENGASMPIRPGLDMALPAAAGLYSLRSGSDEIGLVAVQPVYGSAADATGLAAAARTERSGGEGSGGSGAGDLSWLFLALGVTFLCLNWRRGGGEGN